jgi:hypothetical protein
MRAMISASSSRHRPLNSPASPEAPRWQRIVLWAGAALCVAGFCQHRLWEQWHAGRFGELLVLAALSTGSAWPLRKFARWSWASAQALPWVLALVVFAGVGPVVAMGVLAILALALGSALLRQECIALQIACGLVVLGATLGWLLPLPLHYWWSYLGLAVVLAASGRSRILQSLRTARSQWKQAVTSHPRAAAWTVLALGLASTGCWLPTMQPDDLGYHLRLPWELLEQGRYGMDPETHIWALAPWLGDVLQAFPQVVAGAEARGPVNALLMLVTAAGVWRLASQLSDDSRARWAAVALYASQPLTATLAGSMQTEAPTAALLVWLVAVITRPAGTGAGAQGLRSGAVLAGGLLALKLAAGAMAILLLPWAAWRHRSLLRPFPVLAAVGASLVIGGSSYACAAMIAGNPFLPLFNAYFRSPYFASANFDDARWHAGFNALLPWRMTFDTGRYLEAFAGGGGFVLVALGGAWVVALTQRRSAVIAAVLALTIAIPLLPMQYLRYAFPACVALLPVLAASAFGADPRRAVWLLGGVCLLNFAFQSSGHWMLRTGALKETVRALGDDGASFRHYAPERILLARLRASPADTGNVLALDPDYPHSMEMGRRARTVSPYDPSLARDAALANGDPSGAAWQNLLRREDIGQVLSRKKTMTAAQRAGLVRAGATLRAEQGDAQWWSLAHQAHKP